MAGANTLHFSEADFQKEVLESEQPVLVDFWAEWCGPCRMIGPYIDELADEYAGRVKVGKVDTETNARLAMKYNITSIPAIMLFNKGQLAKMWMGARPKREFKEGIDNVLSGR